MLAAFDARRAQNYLGIPNVGKRQQTRKLIFCLAEAAREHARADLALARSLTFHSNASRNRLLLLCQLRGGDLQPRQCLLRTADLVDDPATANIAT
eukprot:11201213-Lingulodinium_polyedra.AAC.1